MCVCVCVFIETAFFVSQSRGNVVQIFSTDIICEKICSELAGFGEGGTGSACFQSKSISLFMPSVLQPSNTPVRSRALCANDGQTLRGKKKNQTMQVPKISKKRSWSQAGRVRRAQNHFIAVSCREGQLEGSSSLLLPRLAGRPPDLAASGRVSL